MTKTAFSSGLAAEIVHSWEKRRSNFIIVAPPMSNIRTLFSEICDVDFLRSILGEQASNLAIAKLDTSDFKDDLAFARGVLQCWNLSKICEEELDAVGLLNRGVSEIISSKRKPIVVVHRFHEALEKLGEDIGTALRNLEHDHGLKTVVELPVSLSCLRERWDATNDLKPPFLASDWGQGHSLKFLKGYNVGEILGLIPGKDEKIAKYIFSLTGGIPQLTDRLLEFQQYENVNALQAYAKSKASSLCERLITWIDKPNSDFYKRLVLLNLGRPNAIQGSTRLSDHDWKELLINRDGTNGCLMISWACGEKLAIESPIWLEEQLLSSFDKDGPADFCRLVDDLIPSTKVFEDKKTALKLLASFNASAGPYVDDWQSAREISKQFGKLASASDSSVVGEAWDLIRLWLPLINFMCDFSYAKNRNQDIRIEEFSFHRDSVEEVSALLQLLNLRLEEAGTLNPYLALKSVVEQPESLLQLYSYKVAKIRFWKFEGMSEAERVALSSLIKKPFRAPKIDSRLSFTEMLYLIFEKLEVIEKQNHLFSDHAEVLRIEKLYEERKKQVHSTAFASMDNWLQYEQICRSWLVILTKIFKCDTSLNLPKPIEIFSKLAKIEV
jgi:hypothetical protein